MIYYLIADYAASSWGNGMIYEHVRMLREAGYDACALHHQAPFRPLWLELNVPIRYVDEEGFAPAGDDVVVVPEVLAASEIVQRYRWRRVMFVQGSFLIFRGLQRHADYAELGFEEALAILPHVARVVERHFGVTAHVVPPFVAPHFFEPVEGPRQRRVLFATKEGYRALGIPDQEIAQRLLQREVARRPDWQFVPLEGFSHREIGSLMRSSMFLVNVFSHEAFNTTVPEAMAAGCVPVCYEAGGGGDFLRPGENAIVFPNQHVYRLVEHVCELMDRCHELDGQLERLREGGRETAASFQPAQTAEALLRFFATRMQVARR
ncbi:MAG TPA: glycosyltransferase [Thermoanaerobaculia bacterium]|nr:glycosyltransferase [Thermoanaerobaculia bacterium]